jgi:dipeptidyl aminopeptidase/acylaminoacyl peptidase
MNRSVTALVVAVVLVGCTAATTPSQRVSSPSPTAPVPPSSVRTPPPESPLPETPSPGRTPDASVQPVGLIAYALESRTRVFNADGTLESRIWVVNTDGTDAHELLPNEPGSQYPIAWSGDGSRLLYNRGTPTGLALTDAAGSEPDRFELKCPVSPDDDDLLYVCQPDPASVAFSPDGMRLAYTIWEGSHDQANEVVSISIAVLDLSTGRVTKLESTQTTRPAAACDTSGRGQRPPSWSPDGTRLVFKRDIVGASANADCREAILTVNADGSDLRQVVAPGPPGVDRLPGWSPDGSLVLSAEGGNWTRDGRIVSLRFPATAGSRGALWILDADGEHASRLEATIPALTAAGCVVCPYPVYDGGGANQIDPLAARPFERYWGTSLLWQPVPATQP